MQEYRRQIAYLYAYEQGEKKYSAGFVKAELRAGWCRLFIHLKSFCHPKEDAGTVYVYFYHQKKTVAICLGNLTNQNGALEWQGTFSAENILGKGIRFSQTGGVWVKRSFGRDYIAEWDDYPVDISRFVLYPQGGEKCIRCPRFGICERSGEDAADPGRTVYEGSHPAGEKSMEVG